MFWKKVLCALFALAVPIPLGASEGSQVAARVGTTEITQIDIAYRFGIEKAYGNEKATLPAALVSLVNDALEQEIAAAHGASASAKDIETFKKYVDENTKAPELLAKVKAVFKGDEKSYEKIYLAPKVVNRKLHYFYSRDPGIHKAEIAAIERAYSLVVSGMKAFKDAASELGLEYATRSNAGDKKAEMPAALEKYIADSDINDPLLLVVEKMKIGEVYDHIIEDDNGYQVIRLLEKDGKKYSVETVRAKKRPFDQWFREEARKVRIEILDPALKKEILTSYPELWWMKGIMR